MFFDRKSLGEKKNKRNKSNKQTNKKKAYFCAAPSAAGGICRFIAAAFDSTLMPQAKMFSHP